MNLSLFLLLLTRLVACIIVLRARVEVSRRACLVAAALQQQRRSSRNAFEIANYSHGKDVGSVCLRFRQLLCFVCFTFVYSWSGKAIAREMSLVKEADFLLF